jgi:hypothetical protein
MDVLTALSKHDPASREILLRVDQPAPNDFNWLVNKPRHFTRRTFEKHFPTGADWALSHKADGQRVLLAFVSSGRESQAVLFDNTWRRLMQQDVQGTKLIGTVIDCELMSEPNSDLTEGASLLAFDILVDQRMDVRHLPFKERYHLLSQSAEIVRNSSFSVPIQVKPFLFPPSTRTELGAFLRGCEFETDGMILVPASGNYNDPCLKWKLAENCTVDLLGIPDSGKLELYAKTGNKLKRVASTTCPKGNSTPKVYECAPCLGKTVRWEILKERADKTRAYLSCKENLGHALIGPNSLILFRTMEQYLTEPVSQDELCIMLLSNQLKV